MKTKRFYLIGGPSRVYALMRGGVHEPNNYKKTMVGSGFIDLDDGGVLLLPLSREGQHHLLLPARLTHL